MSTMDLPQYQRLAALSGLLTESRLQTVLEPLRQQLGAENVSAEELGRALIESGELTNWHHQCLLRKYKNFKLGDYVLLRPLGRGGAGSVYLAERQGDQRRVALKVLSHVEAAKGGGLKRFTREAQTHLGLSHPNIVEAHDFGTEGKLYFLALEHVEGMDLAQMVERQGPLAPDAAVALMIQACAALHCVHEAGLIHRDVKPANLLADSDNVLKLADLGLVRKFDADTPSITLEMDAQILGTLDYMAPEQATAPHDVGAAADVYSLGCTLYFLLTGKPPFQSGNPTQILLMHQMQKPTPLNVACPEIPAALSDLCSSMIAKQPGDRPASADQARVALSQWLQSVSAIEADAAEAVFVVQVDAGASGEETPGLEAISTQETINGKLDGTVSRNGFPRPDSIDRIVSQWGKLTREELRELLTSPQATEITVPGDDPSTTRRLLSGSRTFLLRFTHKADSLAAALALIDRAARQVGTSRDDPRTGWFALQVSRFWFAVSYQDDPSREKPILNTVAPCLDSASRVCVFSDVHANWPALRVVLKEADRLGADG
ncbi:MAG: serine/threonine protein kinase [Planctomycetales bacterium]